MKASVIHEYGGPEVLRYEDYPDPVLNPGEVLVRVAAAGLNPVDILERSGQTKEWRPIQFPGVIGWDLSGTLERLGTGVKGFSVGDRALAWAYHTYAEKTDHPDWEQSPSSECRRGACRFCKGQRR